MNVLNVHNVNYMNVQDKNICFINGNFDKQGLFPKLEELSKQSFIFEYDFGLNELPIEPGIIIIRGARQLGKSTWLESRLKNTLLKFGAGSAFYLNGEELEDFKSLIQAIRDLLPLFSKKNKVNFIFIDEITSILYWEKALKILADEGQINNTLIITTGSKSLDLRRGTERLPGRKGKISRSTYRFTHISFKEFVKKVEHKIRKDDLLYFYLLTGGSPIAINALYENNYIPEYIISLTKDWVFGETTAQGRTLSSLKWVINSLFKRSGLPCSSHAIAEDAGLANNTIASGYIELLKDLNCLAQSFPLETNQLVPIPRKASKFNFINLLFVTAFHPHSLRALDDLKKISSTEKGHLFEWLVASEMWRRQSIIGDDAPDNQYYWKSDTNEIDLIVNPLSKNKTFIEVKSGKASISDFIWFPKVFPKSVLTIINQSSFENSFCKGISFIDFLSEKVKLKTE